MLGFTTTEKVNLAVAIASGAVALATLFLGWKTRQMARETKRVAESTEAEARAVVEQSEKVAAQAAASEEQSRIGREALQASIRPWLTAVVHGEVVLSGPLITDPTEIHLSEKDDSITCSIPLRNVGNGLALIQPSMCRFLGRIPGGPPEPVVLSQGNPTAAAVGSGEHTRIRFTIAKTSSQWTGLTLEGIVGRDRHKGEFFVEVLYTDASGGQPTWARVHAAAALSLAARDPWRVSDIAYHHAAEGNLLSKAPFAVTRFSSEP
jgi:hypothetical protein